MIPRAVSPTRASTCAAGLSEARLALRLVRGIVVDRMTMVSTSPMATKTSPAIPGCHVTAQPLLFARSSPGKVARVPEPTGTFPSPTEAARTGRRRHQHDAPIARRAGAWLVWWVLLMSFWVVLDNSIESDELLAGAGAAALGAFLAELAFHQAATRFRMRIEWAVPALRLPAQVLRDTGIVFAALWRRLARGEEPDSGFRELPVRYGDDTAEGVTRRVLLIGARSLAPNAFVLGIDSGRDVMVIHQLVTNEGVAEQMGEGE
jgi:multisubunit Na+/H+ antiporter MnhE subunit